MIGRREFITLLGGTAAAWPVGTRAQQASKLPTIGFLGVGSPSTQFSWFAAFNHRLHEVGWIDGRSVAIVPRWAEGRNERFAEIAAEFVALKVNVIVTGGGAVLALMQATSTIPIVFALANDPVASGYVRSLARPGGNVTGLSGQSTDLIGKRLEMLRELQPKAGKIAMLVNPKSLNPDAKEVQEAARALGQSVHVLDAASEGELDIAFRSLAQERDDALIVVSNPLFTSRREQIVTLANYQRIPAIYPLREYVTSGGLVSYGASIKDAYRQSGVYAGRLLKGAKPADLPVMQPTKFELVINLKTAKALGIAVPPTLLARADEVIE